jgi:hypothetical protein
MIGPRGFAVKQKSGCGKGSSKALIQAGLEPIQDFQSCGKVCGRPLENLAVDV